MSDMVMLPCDARCCIESGCAHGFILAPHLAGLGVPVGPYIGTSRDALHQALEALRDAQRERDLAVAHDRQPYPTADAYERACAALRDWQETAGALSEALLALGHHNAAHHQSPGSYDAESGLACVIRACLDDFIGQLP